jgi:hypothetical protein
MIGWTRAAGAEAGLQTLPCRVRSPDRVRQEGEPVKILCCGRGCAGAARAGDGLEIGRHQFLREFPHVGKDET